MLEQMAWLAGEGCSVYLAPVVTEGGPEAELTPTLGARGIEVLDPIVVRSTTRVGRVRLGVRELPSCAGGLDRAR
jgi:hypothetical protein